MGLRERVQALRDRIRARRQPQQQQQPQHKSDPLWSYKAAQAKKNASSSQSTKVHATPSRDLREAPSQPTSVGTTNAGIYAGAAAIAGLGYTAIRKGYVTQAVTGQNPAKQMKRIAARRRKERNKAIKAGKSRVRNEALAYQNVKNDQTPQPRGISQSQAPAQAQTQAQAAPQGMFDMFDTGMLAPNRTTYLAEPAKLQMFRSYGNFDFIGKNSKRGASAYQYDLDEQFR